jgi:hypothetical protein
MSNPISNELKNSIDTLRVLLPKKIKFDLKKTSSKTPWLSLYLRTHPILDRRKSVAEMDLESGKVYFAHVEWKEIISKAIENSGLSSFVEENR